MKILRSWRAVLLMLIVALALFLPPIAAGQDDDRREVEREGSCSGSSDWSLRLRAEDGKIRVEFEIEVRRPSAAWRVVLLHDRRTAFNKAVPVRSGEVRLRRVLTDWYGRDTITVRASGPRTETCRVTASV